MQPLQSLVYVLCVITSFVSMLLLLRSYRRSGSRLLLWSALAFVALAINNLLLFIDMLILPPDISLLAVRDIAALVAVGVLLYGFIWEID